ncbi:hypothetical protein AAHC03_01651 [Spirometra sp. Aus1]
MVQERDALLWKEFERQCDNVFLTLSSSDLSSESDFPECRFGDKVIVLLIDTCRALDSWFVKHRLLLSTKAPHLQLSDEISELRRELSLKEKLLADIKEKARRHVAAIETIVEKLTEGVAYVPDL